MCINSINSRYFDFIILTLVKKILYLGYTTSIHSSMEILGHSNDTREIILMLTMGFPLNAYLAPFTIDLYSEFNVQVTFSLL